MRFLNITLLILAVVGGVFTLRQQFENNPLELERQRLHEQFGNIVVADSRKLYFQSLPSDDPMLFRWRAHFPEGSAVHNRMQIGDYYNDSQPRVGGVVESDRILLVAFRFEPDNISVFVDGDGVNSSGTGIGYSTELDFLKEHWNELEFVSCGTEKTTESALNELTDVFEIRMPKKLNDQMIKEVGPHSKRFVDDPVFRYTIGTVQSFATDQVK